MTLLETMYPNESLRVNVDPIFRPAFEKWDRAKRREANPSPLNVVVYDKIGQLPEKLGFNTGLTPGKPPRTSFPTQGHPKNHEQGFRNIHHVQLSTRK